MSTNLDNLFIAQEEMCNHSHFNTTEIINIEKYISEHKHGIINAIAEAQAGGTGLVISPTGSGKSYSFINVLKNLEIKSVFVLPNSSNVEQAMTEYSIPGAFGDDKSAKEELSKGCVVAMTWDKVSQLKDEDLSEHIIVIDEIHQTYTDDYRKKVIKGLYEVTQQFKGRIDITATPNKLDFSVYDSIIEYKQKTQTKYNVKVYNYINTETIINIINKSNNSAILFNDINTLKFISNSINKKSDIVSSDLKAHSKIYGSIIADGTMGDYDVLLNTSTIVAGVNIKNPNITDVIVVGIKDVGTIKQYISRFRDLDNCNVHIFNTFKESSNIYEVEWLIKENINNANVIKNAYNSVSNNCNEFMTLGVNINPINLDSNIYFNKKTGAYEVDEVYIRTNVYKRYYNSRTIENFKVLLEEYFDCIELVESQSLDEKFEKEASEFKKNLKEQKEAAISILEKNKDILVGYQYIKSNKKPFSLMQYLSDMKLSLEHCQKECMKHDLHSLILNNNLSSLINNYSKYVLENGYSTDIAWRLANMGNRKRGNIFIKLNHLVYRELIEEHPNIFANTDHVEVKIYNWIRNEIKIGTSYTNAHLEILADSFRMVYGDIWAITPSKISEILNQIYRIESKKTVVSATSELIFYRNINPFKFDESKKRLNIYTVVDILKVQDIKNELVGASSDFSIDCIIKKRKNKILNQLDHVEKEILINHLF